jgi:hypothetical protein
MGFVEVLAALKCRNQVSNGMKFSMRLRGD